MALSLSFARAPLVRGGFLVLAFRFSDVASKRDSPPSLFFFSPATSKKEFLDILWTKKKEKKEERKR